MSVLQDANVVEGVLVRIEVGVLPVRLELGRSLAFLSRAGQKVHGGAVVGAAVRGAIDGRFGGAGDVVDLFVVGALLGPSLDDLHAVQRIGGRIPDRPDQEPGRPLGPIRHQVAAHGDAFRVGARDSVVAGPGSPRRSRTRRRSGRACAGRWWRTFPSSGTRGRCPPWCWTRPTPRPGPTLPSTASSDRRTRPCPLAGPTRAAPAGCPAGRSCSSSCLPETTRPRCACPRSRSGRSGTD